jgi:hypothetical protein
LKDLINLIFKHGITEIGHSLESYMHQMYLLQHVQWAMAAISAAPESRVLTHPITIAAGNWTAGTGTLPGNLTMITLAHWKDGRIAQEYLFMQNPSTAAGG